MIRALAPVATLLFSTCILLAGQGLQGTLLPVRAGLESFSPMAIGAMGATYFLGFTLGCFIGGDLVRRVGHIRVFLAMSATASAIPLIHGLIVGPLVWGALRLITGFCLAVLYLVIESWLNEKASNENRGLIFSTYAMATLTMMAGGQLMTLLHDPFGLQLFVIVSILFSIGAVPIALSTSPTPRRPSSATVNLRRLFEISPSGAVGSIAAGLANGSFWSLAPVYAAGVGDAVTMAAWFMTAVVIGGALAQWPLGLWSDVIGRRKIIVGAAVFAAITGIALAASVPRLGFVSTIILGGIWGSMAFPLSTMSVAYANDFAKPREFVMVSSGLLLMYGIGAIAGPFISSALITLRGPDALFWFTCLVHTLLVVFVVYRYLREGKQADRHMPFRDALSAALTKSRVYEEELRD